MSGFNIADFKSEVLGNYGVAKPNLFLVNFYLKENVLGATMPARSMTFFCDSTNLPGVSIGVDDSIRRQGVGVVEKMPYGVFFGDLQTSFIGDGQGKILKGFHNWVNKITNFDPTNKDNNQYEVAYKDSYTATIEIVAYNERAQKIITYTLEECFPLFVGDTQMSWADSNSLMHIFVTFTYRNWHSDVNGGLSTQNAIGNALSNLGLNNSSIMDTFSLLQSPDRFSSILHNLSSIF